MRCKCCNGILETLSNVKQDGSMEDLCSTCLMVVQRTIVELFDLYEQDIEFYDDYTGQQ